MLKKKVKRIRKNITIEEHMNDKLVQLSEQTGYNHSELIELGLRELDSLFIFNKIDSIEDLEKITKMDKKRIIEIALKSIKY